MYTIAERSSLRDALVAAARADARIAGAALTGSGALGAEDEWSDIDLFVGLAPDADQDAVLADWTARIYSEYGAVHHTDVWARGTAGRRVPEPVDLPGRPRLVVLLACSVQHRAGQGVAGGVHDQRVRNHVLMLACLRFGVPHSEGRGLHLLPEATTAAVETTLVRSLEPAELLRAFRASIDVLLREASEVDAELAVRLAGPLRALTTSA
jgi:hypothetical protein